jgi:hypothetical protein
MEPWLRKLSITRAEYLAWSGLSSLREFVTHNPTWPLRAWVGLVLEHEHQLRGLQRDSRPPAPGVAA